MIKRAIKKLAKFYSDCYKKRLKAGYETSSEEDKLFAYCILELNNSEK